MKGRSLKYYVCDRNLIYKRERKKLSRNLEFCFPLKQLYEPIHVAFQCFAEILTEM